MKEKYLCIPTGNNNNMSASLSSMVAAFVTLGVVFTIGLLLISFLKIGNEEQVEKTGITLKTEPTSVDVEKPAEPESKSDSNLKSEELEVAQMANTVESMKDGDVVSLMFYSSGCPWCRRFKSETIESLEKEGKLPFPVKMIQASPAMRSVIESNEQLKKIAAQVKGLPTSVILYKKPDGLYFAPIVGFLPHDNFISKPKQPESSAQTV